MKSGWGLASLGIIHKSRDGKIWKYPPPWRVRDAFLPKFPPSALRPGAASVCLLSMTFLLGASRLGLFVFWDSRMHSVELRSHFCLGRLCERRWLSSSPKLVTPMVTCSQGRVVSTPEENASFATLPKRFCNKNWDPPQHVFANIFVNSYPYVPIFLRA